MSTISSEIARVILEMLEETGSTEIQRNLLAQNLGCVPSQINYVIASRFPPEQGYIVESRRGGGGCIRIRRVRVGKNATLLSLINSVGGAIDEATLRAHIGNLFDQDLISGEAAALTLAACSDDALRAAPPSIRDELRAGIFKRMLLRMQDL